MKKILLLLVLISASCISVLSQTYYYKHIEDVDDNGVKTKKSGGIYITFTKSSCYESDENGYQSGISDIYHYKETKDNLFVYSHDALEKEAEIDRMYAKSGVIGVNVLTMGAWLDGMGKLRYQYFYLSTDFSRLNHCVEKNITEVYIKSDPPKKKEDEPVHFY